MKSQAFRTAFSLARMAALIAVGASAGHAQSVFATLNGPHGVVTDTQGNVLVESVPDNPFAPLQTTRFLPYGTRLAQYTTGSMNSSRFALDAGVPLLWALESSGQIRLMDPATGAVSNYLNLRQMTIDTSHIYNVHTGLVDNFGGVIKTYSSWYGDIAVLRRGTKVDVFVTGVSDLGSMPFVVRIRVLPGPVSAQLLVSSTAPTLACGSCAGSVTGAAGGSLDRPRGIAVNSAGTVLTTLPVANKEGAGIDVGFSFAADFDPASGTGLPRPILGGAAGKGLRAEGAASDNAGRFYVAADLSSSTVYCGLSVGAGALMLAASLDSVTCLGGAPDVIDRAYDVAPTGAGDALYMSTGKIVDPRDVGSFPLQSTVTGAVLKFTNLTASPNCSLSLTPASRNHSDQVESGSVAVTATGGSCTWAASANVSWITLTAGAAGNGNGSISYTVAANPNNTGRQGAITVSGKVFTVYQAGRIGASCTYSVGPASTYLYKAGGGGALTINTPAGCPWTATTDVAWITITSAATGTGSATLIYNVALNKDNLTRVGYLKVAGQSSQVTQFNF